MARYVALGDSYAAGVGAGNPINPCYRDARGYPPLVAVQIGVDLLYSSCSGATTTDVANVQIPSLTADTTVVTVTVGGNDAGFAHVLTECAKPGWMANGGRAIDGALVVIRNDLRSRLDSVYSQITQRAPHARVVVTGYPRLFNGIDCNILTFFSQDEMRRINSADDELNALIATVAAQHGFPFVDVRNPFLGHAVCSSAPFIHGLTWPVTDSFHPTVEGHAAYATAVTPVVAAALVAAGPALQPAIAAGPGPEAEDEMAGHGISRRSVRARIRQGPARKAGSAETFSLPNLLSPESLEGARRAGLDPDRIAALARQLPSPQEVAQGKAELHVRQLARRSPGAPQIAAVMPASADEAVTAVIGEDAPSRDAIAELRSMSRKVKRAQRRRS